MNSVLAIKDIKKSFFQGGKRLDILKGISLDIKKGETVAITGESGCGKSTILHIAGLLENQDSGKILVNGNEVLNSDKKQTKIRRNDIGFIYQQHHLLAEFSSLENVMLPQIISGKQKKYAREKAKILLDTMGLFDRLKHRPAELSGGEQQRVAIARALANNPLILLADEPTGNLDPSTSESIFDALMERVKEIGLSMLMVTHNMTIATKTDRTYTLENGTLN